MPRAVVLLSGGLDSYTAAAVSKRDGFELFALTVRYGQRHAEEIAASRRVAAAVGVSQHLELDVDLSRLGGSALTADIDVPKDQPIDVGTIPVTYVPARNTVFLSLALGWAEVLGAHDLVIGVNALDYSGYPDCRPEFIRAFETLANLATKSRGGRRDLARARTTARPVEGRYRAARHLARPRLQPHAQLLRPRSAGALVRTLRQLPAPRGRLSRGRRARSARLTPRDNLRRFAMTDRLYYADAYRRTFSAAVTACAPTGDRFAVTLDATAFYPTSGGQPHDIGVLGGRAVTDVVVDDDGRLVHVVDGPLDIGAQVQGDIDWTRRFDHMQQHTGQHVLSAAFERVCQARTESFHLGAATATIDLHRVVTPADIAAAEAVANGVVWEDREVHVRFVSAEEAASLPLRKESGRTGTLRLIDVTDFDLSACGGTHVARTGGIGVIAVTGWEKFKGGTRVEFQCGGRALGRLHEWREALAATNRLLSVSPAELAPAIERLQGENRALARTARGFQDQLATHVAAGLVAAGDRRGDRIVVARALDGWDAAGLKAVAAGVAGHPGAAAAVFSTTSPTLVVIARAADVPADASAVLKALVARFGGKGGGKPDLAQGGGLTGDVSEIVAAARSLLGGT